MSHAGGGSATGRLAIATLATGQALGLSGAPLVVMVGSVVGQDLAPRAGLATLPLASMVVGTAVASGPVALLMRRVGRRVGFAACAALASVAGLTAASAVQIGSFALFSAATFLLGAGLASVQQYRFAAAEAGGPARAGRAVALVLAGGIVAGVLGPEIGRRARDLTETPWVGSFLVISLVYVALVLVLWLGLTSDRPSSASARHERPGSSPALGDARPLATPAFLLAAAAGVTAYSVMTLVMTAAPLAMHRAGHGVDETAIVIQAHVIAMYGPSLVSGFLVTRLGLARLLAIGLLALAGSLVCGFLGDTLGVWVAALALLGIGWNLLFLGGTVALATAFPGTGRFRAQALNDTLVFGTQAAASLGSGVVLSVGGWAAIQLVAAVPLGMMGLLLAGRARAPAEAANVA